MFITPTASVVLPKLSITRVGVNRKITPLRMDRMAVIDKKVLNFNKFYLDLQDYITLKLYNWFNAHRHIY